jgi:zinc transport system ATP-binding protein
MPLLCVDNLSLGYDGKAVVSDLSFSVETGDYLCIVGENGSGKSTLMKALLGLKAIDKGQIKASDGLRQTEIGYLPQQTVVQKDFPASVREVVQSGCLNRCGLRPFYNKAERQIARDNMERLGILPIAEKCYRDLSGGQQQRVLLARALCAARRLLLLDEPVAGLDPGAAHDMYELIQSLNQSGITMVMVSHDISAVKYASHILHLGKGNVLFYGRTDEYLHNEASKWNI